jgi:hypothetical protein
VERVAFPEGAVPTFSAVRVLDVCLQQIVFSVSTPTFSSRLGCFDTASKNVTFFNSPKEPREWWRGVHLAAAARVSLSRPPSRDPLPSPHPLFQSRASTLHPLNANLPPTTPLMLWCCIRRYKLPR